MKLIVGLGNPGKNYSKTVHNAGFNVVDEIAQNNLLTFSSSKHNCLLASGKINSESVVLIKPLSFMNLSGGVVSAVAKYYKINPDEIIVIHDDIDLNFGDIRTKTGGSDGGHNGLKSITSSLKTSDYQRVRIGVGRGNSQIGAKDASSWVLKELNGEQLSNYLNTCSQGAQICQNMI